MSNQLTIPKWKTGMRKLTEGVYAYVQAKGSWGLSNAGLIVGNDGAILVDALNKLSTAKAFMRFVRKATDQDIKCIILTHSHGDHIAGSFLLPDTILFCQRNCYEEIDEMGKPTNQLPAGVPHFDFSKVLKEFPFILFDDTASVYLGNKEIHLRHYGYAHTIGDTVVYLPQDGIVFCGDALFLYSTPYSSRGSFSGWINTLNKILELDATVYVPGHGPICGRDGLIKCREYLTFIYDEAKKAFKTGIPCREAALRIPLGEYSQWVDRERVLGNMRCIYGEFNNKVPASRADANESITEMKELAKSGW